MNNFDKARDEAYDKDSLTGKKLLVKTSCKLRRHLNSNLPSFPVRRRSGESATHMGHQLFLYFVLIIRI